VALLVTTNDTITVTGSHIFVNVVDPITGGGNSCTITSAAGGTKAHPATFVCLDQGP
jgi:hypothetical protein